MHLSRLLQPRSIAVLGGVWAENVVIQCKKMGYSGAIFPVHPRRKKMAGVACYHRLINLPEPPDAVFLGINRDAAVTAVAELSAMGAGGVICFASGFAEIGGGILQSKLVAAAADMPLLGPNCYGMVNFLDGVPIWPDQHGGRRTTRGVAIIGQSSNILINLSSQRRGLPIAYLVAAGNQAQCNVTDIARSVMEDKRVSAVGLHLESIDNAADFAAMAALAVQKKVALVALKVGKCHAAQRATASHTAALASEKETSSAFLRRCGIAETDTIGVFMETLKLLHVHGSLAGGRLVSMSCSGGEAAHVADLAATRKLYFSPFSVRQKRALKKTLGERVHIANPLDYHTYIWHNRKALRETYKTVIEGSQDCTMLLLDYPRGDRCDCLDWDTPTAAFMEAASGSKCAVVSTLPENMPEDRAEQLMKAGIAPLCGLDEALAAMQVAAVIGASRCVKNWRPLPPVTTSGGKLLNEAEAKTLLAAGGISTPRGLCATTPQQVATVAKRLRCKSVVIKRLGLAHKTEVGGVRLGVQAEAAQVVATAMPDGNSFLVEEMIDGAVAELLINVRRDPIYGGILTVGTGGVYAEALADTQTRILPISVGEIKRAFGELQLAVLLKGWRGRPAADIVAAVHVAAQLGKILAADPCLLEIEINPLLLLPTGHGAVAVDAHIVKRSTP